MSLMDIEEEFEKVYKFSLYTIVYFAETERIDLRRFMDVLNVKSLDDMRWQHGLSAVNFFVTHQDRFITGNEKEEFSLSQLKQKQS